jgi:hypothetical protein
VTNKKEVLISQHSQYGYPCKERQRVCILDKNLDLYPARNGAVVIFIGDTNNKLNQFRSRI